MNRQSKKFSTLDSDFFSSASDIRIQNTIKLGTNIDYNYSHAPLGVVQTGGAYSQGQIVRSLFDLNDNGTILYDSTELDQQNILNDFSSIFVSYPNLTQYPFLYDQTNPTNITTISENSKQFPIFNYLGKGFGESEFYLIGQQTNSNLKYSTPEYLSFYYTNIFNGRVLIAEPKNFSTIRWPSSGIVYSGTLVQLSLDPIESDSISNNNFKNIKVIPYQSGRGIPQYDPFQKYFSGDAFGIPKYPSYEFDLNIEPELSQGCVVGNNDSCLGISLDTDTNVNENTCTIYKYSVPDTSTFTKEELEKFRWTQWDKHPAPFTAAPKDISFTRTPRIFSPINSSEHYYSPWPNYYAYQQNDVAPILHKGITTVSVGAAFNIGACAYYEPDVADGDDPRGNPNYVSISIVPLFQGEQIKIGSTAYANCLGHEISPEPIGTTPYPPPSYIDASGSVSNVQFTSQFFGIQRDGRRDNPWYDWFDPTYGAVGWTGTPNFLFSQIPDLGTVPIQTRDSLGTNLPFLNQSNQGSVIIQARSTVNSADPDFGSGRMNLIGSTSYQQSSDLLKFQRMTQFPGAVERALPIGKTKQSIQGTGQWTYTGTILDFSQNVFASGAGYVTGLYSTQPPKSSLSVGSGATVNITAVNSDTSIDTITLNSPGINYVQGDIVSIIQEQDPTFGKGTLEFFRNSANIIFDTDTTVSLHLNGTGYQSSIYETGFNISANNLIVQATATINNAALARTFNALISHITSVEVYSVSDVSRYPIGTIVGIMNDSNKENWATCIVDSNDGVSTITLTIDKIGGKNVYDTGTFIYSTEILGFKQVSMKITCGNNDGIISGIDMIDIPNMNKENDLILVNQPGSDKNCIFQLQNNTNRIQSFATKQITGGAGYWYNSNFFVDALTFANQVNLTSNEAEILNPGNVSSGADILIGGISFDGADSVTQASFFPSYASYSGEFGNVQTISQTYPIDLETQPVAGNIPATGWPSFVFRNTATFIQDVRFFIQTKGSNYSIGGPLNVSGGSGADLQVFITEVDENGGIESLKLQTFGNGYLNQDIVQVVGGNNDSEIVLKIPKSRELEPYYQLQFSGSTFSLLESILQFNPIIIEAGTNYTVGGPFTTSCPVYDVNYPDGFQMEVNILSVGSNGEIKDIEIVFPPVNTDHRYWSYQLDYNIIIESGDSNGIIKLSTPLKAQIMQFTNQGTNYTTQSNVSTYNLSQNNLVILCGLETTGAGECEVIDYGASDLKPLFWDLRRYQVGDIIAFNQNGNISATAEITSIDLQTNSISFNQLTVGSGYVQPASSNYGFLPTLNLSQTATTVNVEADSDGFVTSLSNVVLGTNTEYNDVLIVEQETSDNNVVFRIASESDVPAPWQPFTNGRNATASEWNNFKTVLKSSVNLLDQRMIIDADKYYPNYYDNSWYFYGQPDNKDPKSSGFSFVQTT